MLRMIKDVLHMIKNNIMKCVKAIKAMIKIDKSLTIVVSIIILFAIAIIIISVNDTSSDITTFVGIVLSFISILLSYKGLMLTKEVKEDVALQQFKIKQQEEVAKLVVQINKYCFNIDFGYADRPEYPQYCNVNFGGAIQINNTLKEKYPEFLERKISMSNALLFEPFEELSMSAYLPASIAVQLRPFCRYIWDEENVFKKGTFTRYVLMEKSDEDSNRTDKSYSIPTNTFPDWKTFVNKIDNLLNSIREWYSIENNNIEPNIIPQFQTIHIFNPELKD